MSQLWEKGWKVFPGEGSTLLLYLLWHPTTCRLQLLEKILWAITALWSEVTWSSVEESEPGEEVPAALWDTEEHWHLDWGTCRALCERRPSWASHGLSHWHPVQEHSWRGQVRGELGIPTLKYREAGVYADSFMQIWKLLQLFVAFFFSTPSKV